MANCPSCGAELVEGTHFCGNCGAPVAGEQPQSGDARTEVVTAPTEVAAVPTEVAAVQSSSAPVTWDGPAGYVTAPSAGAVGKPPQDKSVAAAILLTLIFGAFGLFYTLRWWVALLMVVAEVAVGVATLGIGLAVIYPVCIIWGTVAASRQHSAFQIWLAQTHGV